MGHSLASCASRAVASAVAEWAVASWVAVAAWADIAVQAVEVALAVVAVLAAGCSRSSPSFALKRIIPRTGGNRTISVSHTGFETRHIKNAHRVGTNVRAGIVSGIRDEHMFDPMSIKEGSRNPFCPRNA